MGMAMSGVTHCRKCGRPLSYAEYGICSICENVEYLEKEKEKERIKKIESERLERVLKLFDDFDECDIIAFKQLLKKLGKENKKKNNNVYKNSI